MGERTPHAEGARRNGLGHRVPFVLGVVIVVALLAGGALLFRSSGGPGNHAALCASVERGAAAGFDVVVITLDTTRADHLGCYGFAGAATPVLDALAAEGVRFADAVTAVPITLPSHATIFTGLNPPNHGIRDNSEYDLDESHVTLAERLKEKGYDTAAFVSAFVLDKRYGLNQGFDVYDDRVDPGPGMILTPMINERSADKVTDAALQWLGARASDGSFFLWVHYFDAHRPYEPPPPLDKQFAESPYDGEIAFTDAQVGRLIAALQQRGTADRTLLVVVGDHGEGLGDHGELTHARLIYDSVMRVPFIVWSPGLWKRGYVVDTLTAATADIVPTLLFLMGLDAAEPLDGINLLDAAAARGNRTVYMESVAPYLDHGWAALFGLRRHEDKYIQAPRPEFYDIERDPGELDNLFDRAQGAHLAARDVLAGQLDQMLARWPNLEAVAAAAQPLDPETIQRLQSLGYVAGVAQRDPPSLADPKDMVPIMQAIDRANGFILQGRLPEALKEIESAYAKSPGNRRILKTLVGLYLMTGREPEAEEGIHRLLEIRPDVGGLVLLAQIMIKDGRHEEAWQRLQQAQAIDRQHGAVYVALGDLLAIRGKPQQALAAYEQAVKVDPYRIGDIARQRSNLLRQRLEEAFSR